MGVAVNSVNAIRFRSGVASFAVALALAGSLPAQAQTAVSTPPEADAIVVTGTRIRALDRGTVEPTVRLDASYLADRNLTNLADALRESPGVRVSPGPNGAQNVFGQGASFVNLYGLGVNRTLTLVNGRRVVSSSVPSSAATTTPGTPVDLNAIPTILIERVDRLSVGGAPVYGTDAIAGTVNVVLKRRMTGLDLEATAGLTSAGDNQRLALAAAGGFDFADGRANLTGALGWTRSEGVLANARPFYRANVFALTNPCSTFGPGQTCTTSASPLYIGALGTTGRTTTSDGRLNPAIGYNNGAADGFPGQVLVANAYFWPLSRGGVIASGTAQFTAAFDNAGNIVPYNTGIRYPNSRASGGDGYRPNDYAQITSDLERLNAAAFFTFDLTDRVRLFAEGLYSRTTGDQLVAAPTNNAVIQGGPAGALTFQVDNPLLTTQARQWFAANSYTSTFTLSRTNADLVDLSGRSTIDVYRIVGGVEGAFDLGGRAWNFEAYLNYGRSDVADRFQDIHQQNFINAVNGCSTTSTVWLNGVATVPVADPACRALNLFGEGMASAEARAYVTRDTVNRSRLQQLVANANVGGSPFDLNGNPVALNLGIEHHVETGRFTPDSFIQRGLGRAAPVSPTSGSYRMNEQFAEVLVPFITPANAGPVSRLEAFGRIRNVDNSTNGVFRAWAAGGTFAPVHDVTFRGNFTRSFRAPSITELYSLRTPGNFIVPDLCSPANIGAGAVPAVRAANCAAFLARYPGATPLTASVTAVPGWFGGNPGLRNEVANSFTYGVVLRPRFASRLSLAIDYVNIKVTDPVTVLSVAAIASGCFDNITFNAADPANANPFCSLIQRQANGQVVTNSANPGVTSGYVNGKRIRMDAIQATLDWSAPLVVLGVPGTFGLGADVFYLRNRLVDVTGVAPVQSEGVVGDPRFQAQARLRYDNAAWGASTTVNVTGAQAVAYTNRAPGPNDVREFDRFDPFATFDAALWIKAADRFRLTLSVTNVFNRVGQSYNGYIIPASINDALGRRFALGVRTRY